MSKLRILDLFSGIGGFSLGLERTGGFETVAFCEIEPFPRRVLAKHWPEVPCYEDVRSLTADILARDGIAVDVITGGFPCQDISTAGKQRGMGEGTRSGLWSEIIRLVGELRPQFVIVENVAALLSGPPDQRGGWFSRILGDLAECGYDAEWENIPAAALGAPHRRERVWIVAYPQQGVRPCRILSNSHNVPVIPNWPGASQVIALLSRGRRGPDNNRRSLRDDAGFPAQLDRIAACGNAVVPQIPELIGRAILATRGEPMTWASLFRRRAATTPVAAPMPASALAAPAGSSRLSPVLNTPLTEIRLRCRALRLRNRNRGQADQYLRLHMALRARFGEAEVTG